MFIDKWLYNFARKREVEKIKILGDTRTVGGSSVTILMQDGEDHVMMCYGATVPTDGGADYGKGCIFYYTAGAAGTNSIHLNVGSSSSCKFVPLNPVPLVPPNAAVTAKGATDTTIAVSELDGLNCTNTGAAGTIQLTLPAAADFIGRATRFQITVAQIVQIVPATGEKIYLGGSGVADKYLQIAGVIGNYAELYSDGTDYHVTGYSGVLTKQA